MSLSAKTFVFGAIAAFGLALPFGGTPAWSQDAAARKKTPDAKKQTDLEKELDDALKQIEKLDTKDTDEAKKLQQGIRRPIQIQPGGFGGIAIGGFGGVGGIGGIGAAPGGNINDIFDALNGNLGGNIGPARRPGMAPNRLGAVTQPVEKVLEEQLQLPPNQGQIVTTVQPNSAAAKAGLKPHDILLELNGKAISSNPAAFQKELGDVKTDTEVAITLLRAGKKETIKGLKLPQVNAAANPANNPLAGLEGLDEFAEIQQQLQQQMQQIEQIKRLLPGGGLPGGGLPGGFPGGFPGLPGGIPLPPVQIPGGGGAFQFPQNGILQLEANVFNLNGAANEATAISVNPDGYVVKHTAGAVKFEIKGKQGAGASEITIEDGDTTVRAQSVDQVPAMYRATVNRLIESVK